MRTRARAVPFARTRPESLTRDMAVLPVAEWPKHLRLARSILIDKRVFDEEKALAVLVASYCAAHACAQAINQRSRDIADFAQRLKLRKIFKRIAKCARRSPAPLRRLLDRGVGCAIHDRVVDAESIEALIQALIAAFASFPKEAPALTVLRAIAPLSSLLEDANIESPNCLDAYFAEASVLLQQEYSALRAIDQRTIENALTALRDSGNAEFDAADVCESIARALDGDKGISLALHDLITEYVAVLAEIWLQNGVKPARAARSSNPSYRGKFHRFADLVLTAAVEPWSKRHDVDNHELLATLRKAHARLPSDIRKFVSCAPRRRDVEWLVSDDLVKTVLTRFKKRPPKHHTRSSFIQR
jgi:hypothetical protein